MFSTAVTGSSSSSSCCSSRPAPGRDRRGQRPPPRGGPARRPWAYGDPRREWYAQPDEPDDSVIGPMLPAARLDCVERPRPEATHHPRSGVGDRRRGGAPGGPRAASSVAPAAAGGRARWSAGARGTAGARSRRGRTEAGGRGAWMAARGGGPQGVVLWLLPGDVPAGLLQADVVAGRVRRSPGRSSQPARSFPPAVPAAWRWARGSCTVAGCPLSASRGARLPSF